MSDRRRLEELLAERATQGLAPAEESELQALLASNPEIDEDGFDVAAAALSQAMLDEVEPMPRHLRQAVLDRAGEEMGGSTSSSAPAIDFESARARHRAAPERATPWAPWLTAAAALVLAVAGWWPRVGGDGGPEIVVQSEPPGVEQAPDAIRWAWSGTEDPAVGEVGGEVVWSGAEQRGLMRIRGLAANDPGVEQYQLWIFDRARDERYPVDGGVFDVTSSGEVLIPIDAKIAVEEPVLFAVTVEKPGGVVVSSRERIVLLAQA